MEQQNKSRFVFVAELDGHIAGYVTLVRKAKNGPFQASELPEVADFNVFEKYQKQGIGSSLLAAAENKAEQFSSIITLGVGLHKGYGAAQRIYVKRGTLPDGSGVWFENKNVDSGEACMNNDDLCIYMSKNLKNTNIDYYIRIGGTMNVGKKLCSRG
ncbi:GNAT family N-acetyltransferase [Carnobacterium antarcticum]|uniref:GNAT family N-acetyltransferase n=1 Tax=Carnobacterium antarcticum TaxID=2126436 RepID=A0ABW4NRZ7_9LACT